MDGAMSLHPGNGQSLTNLENGC